jgi:WD40 repeat protein
LTPISYPKEMRPTIVACGPGRLAVGMTNGKAIVYDDAIFQEVQELDHKEPVWRLTFGEDIILWDFAQDQIHDIYEKETDSCSQGSTKLADGVSTVRALTFSRAIGTNILATTYSDVDLHVYDTESGDPKASYPGANTMVLASSPDGRRLTGSDSRGNIILFDFETIKFLYRIWFDNCSIIAKSLAIMADSFRLIEVRGNQCRVWEPPVLLRQDMDDEQSDTVSLTTGPQATHSASRSLHTSSQLQLSSAVRTMDRSMSTTSQENHKASSCLSRLLAALSNSLTLTRPMAF